MPNYATYVPTVKETNNEALSTAKWTTNSPTFAYSYCAAYERTKISTDLTTIGATYLTTQCTTIDFSDKEAVVATNHPTNIATL